MENLNKEKQIDEMAHILCGMENSCDECIFDKVKCYERLDAVQIYNAGYRKSTDFAREIFEEIEKFTLDGAIGGKYPTKVINPSKYAELKKKYTESEGNK